MEQDSGRRGQILDAALEEFSSRGFRGATIKGIANAAGISSPALIYWYFQGGKESLFQAVLEAHLPIVQVLRDADSLLDRPPEEVLPSVARSYLATVEKRSVQRLGRLVLGEALRRPEVAEMLGRHGPERLLAFLNRYLAHQVELGILRPHDVRASSRALIGMFIPQAVGKVFLPAIAEGGPTDKELVDTAIDLFLRGLRPDPNGYA